MIIDMANISRAFGSRRLRVGAGILAALMLACAAWLFLPHLHRRPPSIFDSPVDDVLGYLGRDDFGKLSIEERVKYLQGIIRRFSSMNQTDSVVASSFLAGLKGPASEKIVQNARVLGKDIFVQGAAEYLNLQTEEERNAYLDQWIVKWVRFGEESTGRVSGRSDDQILANLQNQAKRDLKRGIDINADMAQQMLDFWDRDVASVASPKEQAQIFQFGPALRQRILSRQ